MPELKTPGDVVRELHSYPEGSTPEEVHARAMAILNTLDIPALRHVQETLMQLSRGIDRVIARRIQSS